MKTFKQFLFEERALRGLDPYSKEPIVVSGGIYRSLSQPLYHRDMHTYDSIANMEHPHHRAAEEIHKAWRARNEKSDLNAHQHVDYRDLPEAEQRKDIEHVETVGRLMDEIPVPKGGIDEHRLAVASAFGEIQHENWRKGLPDSEKFNPDGTVKPRMRMKFGKMVDLNRPWNELDDEAKRENYEAGLAAYDAHTTHVGSAQY